MRLLASAERFRRQRIALAERAVKLARREPFGSVVVRHQAAGALLAAQAVGDMLAEQDMSVEPAGTLQVLAFTADSVDLDELAVGIEEQWRLDRLAQGLVLGAMLGAESVAIASRPKVGYVRFVGASCCSRCAILAGRFYRYSDGFLRHPNCLCQHLPTMDPRSEYRQDPQQLVDEGRVTGLSKADARALADGADLSQIVNYRRGGLRQVHFGGGRTVTVSTEGVMKRGRAYRGRTGRRLDARLTPASIYQVAETREEAIRLLRLHGYLI